MKPKLLLVASAALLTGCFAGTFSTTSRIQNSPQMFPLSPEDADRVLMTAMQAQFSDNPISKVESPHKGYQTIVRFGFDSDSVMAYMIPATGKGGVPGYAFTVHRSGTMVGTGSVRARNLFDKIVRYANERTNALPLVGN